MLRGRLVICSLQISLGDTQNIRCSSPPHHVFFYLDFYLDCLFAEKEGIRKSFNEIECGQPNF